MYVFNLDLDLTSETYPETAVHFDADYYIKDNLEAIENEARKNWYLFSADAYEIEDIFTEAQAAHLLLALIEEFEDNTGDKISGEYATLTSSVYLEDAPADVMAELEKFVGTNGAEDEFDSRISFLQFELDNMVIRAAEEVRENVLAQLKKIAGHTN